MSDPIMPHKYVESKTRFNAFMQPCCDVCGKMRDDYPELHNTYDPVESLREEVNRFKETNRFSPMTVTNFFVQAGLTIERLDQLKSTLTHYESALKEALLILDRLGSMEAFCAPRAVHVSNDEELLARIDYAQEKSESLNKVLGEK